jgi:competence protein ComEA
MKKACLFFFLGLTIFLLGVICGIIIGRQVYGSTINIQQTPHYSNSDNNENTSPTESYVLLVDINSASVDLLDTLPGIGPATAQKIVDYRQSNGPFHAKEDLLNINGIGKEKLAAIYDLITVEVEDENTGS